MRGQDDPQTAMFRYKSESDARDGRALGNASAALKQTYRGDITWATGEDVLELVERGGADGRLVRR